MKYEGGYYHVYNRGVDKRKVFNTEKDYKRFLQSLIEFNTVNPIGSIREVNRYKVLENSTVSRPPRSADADLGGLETTVSLVKIYAYCLLPNHFHLLVKEEQEKGVGRFMSKVGNGYTKYFNIINNRSGFLFQGKYKKKLIDNENYLAYLTAYINCNSEIHEIKKAEKWKWSSLNDYLNKIVTKVSDYRINKGLDKEISYSEHMKDVVKNAKSIKDDKRLYLFENI